MKMNTFKSRLRVAITAAALCTLTACSAISGQSSSSAGADNATTPSAGSNTNVKSLVVYFSRAGENYWHGDRKNLKKGNTAVLAEEIAKQTDADVYEIVAADPYSDDYGATVARNVREEDEDSRPAIAHALPDLSRYQVVYLGSPVWNSTMPMIMKTFVEQAKWQGQQVRPFVTYAVSGMAGIDEEYQRLLPDLSVTQGLAVRGEDVAIDPDAAEPEVTSETSQIVNQWVNTLSAQPR